jgi:hypothetical protein
MARKRKSGRQIERRDRDWISFSYQMRVPRGMSLAEAFEALRNYIEGELRFKETGNPTFRRPLPRDLRITWSWRNAPDKQMLSHSIQSAVRNSRAGYLKLMLQRIERDLARLPREEVRAAKEAAPKREQERRRRSEAAKAGWRRRKRLEELRKRAQAARKAAATRKRKATRRRRK